MPGTVEITQNESSTFWSVYADMCFKKNLCPQRFLRRYLEPRALDCSLERLKEEYWIPFLEALAADKSLKYITLRNTSRKDQLLLQDNNKIKRRYPVFPPPAVLQPGCLSKLCISLSKQISHNNILRSLQLEGLTFLPKDLNILIDALQKTSNLQYFSLANCPIGDKGVEILCHKLRNSSSVRILDLSSCNISERGARAVSSLIKFQGMRRHSEAWMESLRYHKPKLDGLSGISRISLNCNPQIENLGVEALADALADDMWIKALDLQCCHIGEVGARDLVHILPKNYVLEIVDVRQNPLIAKDTLERIVAQLKLNTEGKVCEYDWLPLQKKLPMKPAKRHKSRSKSVTPSHSHFLTRRRSLSAGSQDRMYKKDRCPDMVRTTTISPSETDASSRTNLSHQLTDCNYLKKELEKCRHNFNIELEAKKQAQQCLLQVTLENEKLNEQLKRFNYPVGCTLVDDATLATIQSTFVKFQSFLKMLQKAGLEDLLKGSDIDKSLFEQVHTPLANLISENSSAKTVVMNCPIQPLDENIQVMDRKKALELNSGSLFNKNNSVDVSLQQETIPFYKTKSKANLEQTVSSIKKLVNSVVNKQKLHLNSNSNEGLIINGEDRISTDRSATDDLFGYVTKNAKLVNEQLLQCDMLMPQDSEIPSCFPLAVCSGTQALISTDQVKLIGISTDEPDIKTSMHEKSNDGSLHKIPIPPSDHVDASDKESKSDQNYSNTFELSSRTQTSSSASAEKTAADSESIPEILTGSDNDDF